MKDASSSAGRRTWGDDLVDTLIRQGRLPANVRERNRPGLLLDALAPPPAAVDQVAHVAPSIEVAKPAIPVAVRGGGPDRSAPSPSSPPPSSGPEMNKTEARWGQVLIAQGHSPRFNALTLIISSPVKRRRYTPDFLIAPPSGLELHEVKGGYVYPDAELKFEQAVEQWGDIYTFVWAQWKRGDWIVRRYPRRGM